MLPVIVNGDLLPGALEIKQRAVADENDAFFLQQLPDFRIGREQPVFWIDAPCDRRRESLLWRLRHTVMVDQREKWNQKYRQRTGDPQGPDPFLVEVLRWLRPGSVLDLACGDGRNSLYLAGHGHAVTGIDIAEVGLARLRSAADDRTLVITTLQTDLEAPDLHADWGPFDNVLIFNYKPSERLLASVPSLMKKGGTFVFCTFNQKNRDTFNPAFSLKPAAYKTGLKHFELVYYAEPLLDGKHRDGYVFRKV